MTLVEEIRELWNALNPVDGRDPPFALAVEFQGTFWRCRCGEYQTQGDSAALAVEGMRKALRAKVAYQAERAQKALAFVAQKEGAK